jgi:hypothetical protein
MPASEGQDFMTDISRRAASHVVAIVNEARRVWPDDLGTAVPGDTLDRLVDEAVSEVGAATVIYAMAAVLTRSTDDALLRDLERFMAGWEPGGG